MTNEFGEAPLLPNNGYDANQNYLEYSSAKYVSHIALKSIPLFEPPQCNAYEYFDFHLKYF